MLRELKTEAWPSGERSDTIYNAMTKGKPHLLLIELLAEGKPVIIEILNVYSGD